MIAGGASLVLSLAWACYPAAPATADGVAQRARSNEPEEQTNTDPQVVVDIPEVEPMEEPLPNVLTPIKLSAPIAGVTCVAPVIAKHEPANPLRVVIRVDPIQPR